MKNYFHYRNKLNTSRFLYSFIEVVKCDNNLGVCVLKEKNLFIKDNPVEREEKNKGDEAILFLNFIVASFRNHFQLKTIENTIEQCFHGPAISNIYTAF